MDNNINVRRKIVPCCYIMIIIPNLKKKNKTVWNNIFKSRK